MSKKKRVRSYSSLITHHSSLIQITRHFNIIAVAACLDVAEARGLFDGERARAADGAERVGAEDERGDEEAGLVHKPRAQKGARHARAAFDQEPLNLSLVQL